MEKISDKLAKHLLEDNPDLDESDEIRFGIELILTQTILFLMILIIGVLSNSLLATIIYLVVLISLRTVSDGYHADSFSKCAFITVGNYLICLFVYQSTSKYIVWICLLLYHV